MRLGKSREKVQHLRNLGIGVTAPHQVLTVNGNVAIDGNLTVHTRRTGQNCHFREFGMVGRTAGRRAAVGGQFNNRIMRNDKICGKGQPVVF